jgi:hypothetical protein
MSQALETSGNPNVAEAAKQARLNWKAYKEEFDPKSLTEQIIADRPRSTIPQIEASQVYQKIAANAVPVEQVDRLYQSLKNEGARGRRAIADLQSSMMLDLMDSSLKGITRQIDGQQMISGPAMARRWQQLENKAKVVFQDNPTALRQMQDVVRTAQDITPSNMAVPKGSAGFLMDAMQQMGVLKLASAVPGGGIAVEGLRKLAVQSRNQASFRRAVNANPEMKRTADILASDYPSLAAALGLGYLMENQGDSENEPNPNQ